MPGTGGIVSQRKMTKKELAKSEQYERIRTQLEEENPEALLADGYDEALIGVARRSGQPTLAVYDIEKCIQVLMKCDHMSREEAEEFFDFNTLGAWMGEHMPIYADLS